MRPESLRFVAFLALFAALTAGGIWWASPRGAAIDWQLLQLGTCALLFALAVGLVGAELLRFVAFGRALGVRVGFWAALDAAVANNFFSWVSPAALLGEPAAIYMLGRRGVPWDAAALIAFGKFATSFVFIMGLSAVLVGLGFGPPVAPWVVLPFVIAVGTVTGVLSAFIAGAFWPEPSARFIARVERGLLGLRPFGTPLGRRVLEAAAREARRSIERLAAFRRGGFRGSTAIVLSHGLYYALFVGILLVLARAFGSVSMPRTVPLAIVYQGFVYLVPTPGGAGVGEASAELFFGAVLPEGRAFAVVLLFRAFTFYFQILLGLLYLPFAGGVRSVLLSSSAQR